MYKIIVILILVQSYVICANELCSRVANVNYQEILVDLSNNQKGEGLKYYLNQDTVAKSYFKQYQLNSNKKWYNAVLGSLGTVTILAAATTSDKNDRQNLLISGAVIFAVNYLTAKTMQYANERYLTKSIEEYNKRNLPKIYMGVGGKNKGNKIYIQQNWNY